MKNSIIKYMALGLMLILPFACSDFLDESNPNEISTDSFWNTLDDCDAGLIGVYNAFKNGNILSIVPEYNRSDMTWPGWGRPNTTDPYYLQTFTDASQAPNSKWDALYKGIFRANQVVAAVDTLLNTFDAAEDIERATVIKAQARFLRGLFYFYLHNSFNDGSVIIYDFVPQEEAEFYQTIRPAEEVREYFTADLKYAFQNLPPSWNSNNDLGRVTAGAAAAVLGKSYLYAQEYDSATVYFREVIENPDYGYALTYNIGDNFTTLNELNEESILEINYSLNYKSEISPWAEEQVSNTLNYSFSPVGGWRVAYPSCWLAMAYKNDPIDINNPRNIVSDADGTQHFRTYSLRTSWSIALPDDPDLDYYGDIPARTAQFNNKETSYWRKYTNWDIVENEKDIIPTLRSGVNVRVIRLADVYLMYAESIIKGGSDETGVEEAMKYINRVRYRSALQLLGLDGTGEYPMADHNDIVYSALTLMEHLMYIERPLELSVEGNAIRTIDLRRWGITQQRFTELSQIHYYREDYPYIDSDGQPQTKWGSILLEGEKDEDDLIDFAQAAANYNEAAHAYWPLPSSEIISNPEYN